MDGEAVARRLKALGLGFTLLLLISLITFDLYDPTIANLSYPHDGIANMVGLPGALIGGSLVELLGASSLWLPLLFINWLLPRRPAGRLGACLIYGAIAVLFSSTLHSLAMEEFIPALTSPGLAGMAAGRWMNRTLGTPLALFLLTPALGYALVRALYLPFLNAALRDAAVFTGFLWRIGWSALNARRMAAGVRVKALGAALRGRGVALRRDAWGMVSGGLPVLPGSPAAAKRSAANSAGQKHSAGHAGGRSRRKANPRPEAGYQGDGFKAWFSALGDEPPKTGTSDST